jgi:hypothetical protein
MEDTSLVIQTYLNEFRNGHFENALCGLTSGLTSKRHDIIPELIAAFKKEQDEPTRVFLVEAIWQYRQQSVIPFLAEVLHDPNPDIWKKALDGLVTLASPRCIDALRSARTRQFKRERDAEEYRSWIDEAIEQAEDEIKNQLDVNAAGREAQKDALPTAAALYTCKETV